MCVHVYISIYVHMYKCDNNQEIENVISPFSHRRGSFTHHVELVL